MAIYHRMDNAIQHEEIYKELAERLREELDYEREAAQMRLYGLMLANDPTVHVPVPIAGYCTRRLLTMTWLDGRPLMQRLAEDPPQEERNQHRRGAVPRLVCAVLSLRRDPWRSASGQLPGAARTRSVNLLDFGAIRVFGAKFVRGVIDLYEAVRDNDDAKAHHAYETWGFTDLSKEKMAALNLWARFLYEPLCEDRVRRIQETDDPQFGREVAERVHAGLKRTGGVKPPREFVLMDRSAIGLGGVFLRLKAELNWSRLFGDLIADFDEFSAGRAAGRGIGRGRRAVGKIGVRVSPRRRLALWSTSRTSPMPCCWHRTRRYWSAPMPCRTRSWPRRNRYKGTETPA